MRKKFTMLFASLLACVGVMKAATPTEELKASTILPSMGIPEYQFYIRGTINNKYWTSTTDDTDNVNSAGKFALYAVPGLQGCYYLYSIDAGKWLTYPNDNRDNRKDFVQIADNFDANAYWKITESANDGNACYQLQPTSLDKGYDGETRIKTDRYANWYQGPNVNSSIGLWETGAAGDAGSAWSFISVDVTDQLDVLLSQKLAVAYEILASQAVYAKGEGFLTTENANDILSSPYSDSDEGKTFANVVDGNSASCWHSDWHGGAVYGGSHYVVVTLGDNTPDLLSFSYSRRSAADNDHTVRWAVYGVPANEEGLADNSREGLTLLAMISTPWGNKNEVFNNLPNFRTLGFKKFRIYSEATEENRGYFHIGEFQLNANTFADSNEDKVKELAAAVATAETLETVTQGDIDVLNAKIALFGLSEEDKVPARGLLNLTGVGYPAANSAARLALESVLNDPAADILALEAAITAYKTSTEVALPVGGKAYQFAMVANNAEKAEYKITANGTTLTAAVDGTASTFYCVEYTNVNGEKRYAFISEEGKFLGYHALTDSYMTHINADKRLQNDCSFAAMTGVESNNVTSEVVDRFGTVTLRVDNRILERQGSDGYFILNFSNQTFDKSSAPFHNATYTSAIKVTEVIDYTPSATVLTAASTVAPLVEGYKRIGEGVNKYAYTYGETAGNDFTVFETAIKTATTAVNSSDYSFTINQPEAGFYRIKSMNSHLQAAHPGRYLQNYANGNGLKLDTNTDAKSIMYISGNTILSYGSGLYINDYDGADELMGEVGTESTSWGIVENAQVVGTYALCGQDGWYASDWTSNAYTTYGSNDANAAWVFEEVVSLPVAVGATGYASFYSPIAVTLPESLTAYYVESTTANAAVLKEITDGVIPANTGVLLYDGVAEAVTYNLTVGGEASVVNDNMLEGTAAKSYIAKDAYVLAKPAAEEGQPENPLGFYRAELNQQDNTSFINNAFKAYLVVEGASAPMFSFDRGEGTTGIDNSRLTIENSAIIYDLAGRRVEKMEKGIYIVNGRKVIR